jgi:1,4-alpha-glucan branching enzyme
MIIDNHWKNFSKISPAAIQSFTDFHCKPDDILGIFKEENNSYTIRYYNPDAISVKYAEKLFTKLGESGFFELHLDSKPALPYTLHVSHNISYEYDIIDPYQFPIVGGDMDLHLFANGTHYKLWEFLGANPLEINGTAGTIFRVWAPNAEALAVIGDFNSWDGRRHRMNPLGDSGVWELFIPSVSCQSLYKFEIWNRGQHLTKLDPMAKLSELRPKLSSIVCESKYSWNDKKWLNQRSHNINKPLSIYEVHLGSWKKHPHSEFYNYQDLIDNLIPYAKDMGYTHLQLMPVSEHPLDQSWGYQVTGYFSPTARYGSPDELKRFIDVCHQNNIGVFLDWVPAHFPKDDQALGRFDGTACYEHLDPKQGEHPHWGTFIFNYARNEVSNFLIANALYWMDEFHFDGLRVDAVASMLYLDYGKEDGGWVANEHGHNINFEAIEFLKHMNSVISSKFPTATMIAEESTSFAGITTPVNEGGIGFQYKWNMGWMNDFLDYMEKEPIHRKHHQNDLTFSFYYAFDENFINVLSHDEVVHGKQSLIGKMPGDLWQKTANLKLLHTMSMVHPGKQLTFMGGDFGQTSEWNESQELDWHLLQYPQHQDLHKFFKDLNHLYTGEKAFWPINRDSFTWLDASDENNSVICFARHFEGDHIVVVGNFTPVPRRQYRVGVPSGGCYEEIFNTDSNYYGGSDVGNAGKVYSEGLHWHHQENSVLVDIPPLGILLLKHKKT